MRFSQEGRSVVVTGGSRGIGRGIAAAFADAGARVAVTGRDESALARATEALPGASWIAADTADPEAVQRVADTVEERHGGVDVVVANAGVYPQTRLRDMDVAELDRVLDTNLKGTILTVRAFLPALRRSPTARVVVVSSITGPTTGSQGWTHYGASKAGQLGFVRSAALELAPEGITVNAVLPGAVATESLPAEYADNAVDAVPLGRLGSPADVAAACLFLASVEAAYITGQSITVDGGQVLPGEEGSFERRPR